MAVRVYVCVIFLLYIRSCLCLPPHIVFIVGDDLGWNDVGWHNSDIISPNLDKLAKAGVILNSSYVQPLCTPSRTAFMTGYFPYHTGLQHQVIMNNAAKFLPKNFTLLPQKLKELGYATHIVGKWHLGSCNWDYTPTYRGFDSFLGYYGGQEDYYLHTSGGGISGYDFRMNKDVYHPPNGSYSADIFASRAEDIISSHDPTKQPLYLYLPFQSVHGPLEVPKKYEDMYSSINDENRRVYSGMVSALDGAVGRVTQALDKHGFMNNTLIVFTADGTLATGMTYTQGMLTPSGHLNGGLPPLGGNNLPLRGTKATLWEGGTKGAAFVYSKTLLKKTGYVNTGLMHAVDWFPTLLSVAGGQAVEGIDGQNMWPTLSENEPSPRTEFIYNIDDILENAAIRVGNYKLIEGNPGMMSDWYPVPKLNSGEKDEENGDQEVQAAMDGYMLFDIENDPTEHFDIADKNPDIVEKLKERLTFYKQSLVPAQNPPIDPKSNPNNYDGNWSPGWC